MDKITGNYLTQTNKDFPMDCETLDYMATNAAMLEMLGNIAGDKVILQGCEYDRQTRLRGEGYVFLRTQDCPQGEVLRFEGGNNDSGMYVNKQDISVTADGYSYPKAYTKRTLAPGMGTEHYSWDDFTEVQTNRALYTALTELQATVQALVGEPLGIVKMWAGAEIPEGYHLCDGTALPKTVYPALYTAIGDTFNTAKDADGNAYTTQSGYFRLPDLRGRFVVGYRDTDTEYNQYGKTGGEKKHLLTAEESGVAEHTHAASTATAGSHSHQYNDIYHTENGGSVSIPNGFGSAATDYDNAGYELLRQTKTAGDHTHDVSIEENEAQDASTTHENRPPYYVLAYIMKLQ